MQNIQKIFITGASGCIGHYVIDKFINKKQYELHLLVRDPKRLNFDYANKTNIKIHIGNLEFIEELKDTLKSMDYLIHIATDWSNSDYAFLLNVEKTHKMFDYCENAKRIVYFSTASILGPGNKPIEAASKFGSGYIRSKFKAYEELQSISENKKVITVFPTLVFGGDDKHPYSHLSGGITPNLKYLKVLRFFYPDIKFHFLHGQDIASVVDYLLTTEDKLSSRDFVLGSSAVYGKEAMKAICKVFNINILFQIKITASLIMFFAKIFKIEIDPWTKYCINNPYFEYNTVDPRDFGLECEFPDLETLLRNIKNLEKPAQNI